MVTLQPINFLSMIDSNTGKITHPSHELFGKSIKDIILVFPNAIGSSVGAYVIYSMRANGVAPRAMVCTGKCDIITASGCAVANVPLVDVAAEELLPSIDQETLVNVDADDETITVL